MQINLIDDSSVGAAPPGFATAIAAAAQFLDNLITNPITVDISVGWGEDDNGTYPIGSNLSLGGALAGIGSNYSALKSDLISSASTGADKFAVASLPVSDPTNGGSFFVSDAEAQALGLLPSNSNGIEGAVGFNSSYAWNFSTDGQAVSGEIDLVSDAELELAHALGMELGDGSDYTAMMLFRYSAPGVRELTVNGFLTPASYLSIDGGKTSLDNYDASLGDSTLWNASTAGNDTFAIPYNYGEEHVFSLADATELSVLGFDVNTSALEASGTIYGTSGKETIFASELPAGATFDGDGTGYKTVIFDGSSNQYSIVSNGNSSVTITDTIANRDGTHTLVDVQALQFLERPAFNDFTGDGTSDVLYRNDSNGDTGFYAISNGANSGWHDIGVSSTAYSIVGTGDFFSTGDTDILYRDNVNGDTGLYKIINGMDAGWVDLGASSSAYSVVGLGDFYGTGTDDILFRDNATGDIGFYQMSNGANVGWHDIGASSTAYSVVGVGDFTGSGTDDILFRDNATGDTGFYTMSNGANDGWVDLGASSTAYSVVGVGDFTGSGTDDILFRNNSSGDTGYYQVVNGAVTGWHDIGATSTAYNVVAVGDYNGSGTDDILFRNNTTGDTGFYKMVNGANTGWVDVGASSTAYHVVS